MGFLHYLKFWSQVDGFILWIKKSVDPDPTDRDYTVLEQGSYRQDCVKFKGLFKDF